MAVTIRIVMEPRVQEILAGWGGMLGPSFRRLEREIILEAKPLVPSEYSKVGTLRESISGNSNKRRSNAKGIWFEVGSSKPYALFIESGTRPHTIVPKNPESRLVFHWRVLGRKVRMKSVSHPGNKAYRYLETGLALAFARWINSA